MRTGLVITSICSSLFTSACGLYVPEMEEPFQAQTNEKLYENTIINNIKCELTEGVANVLFDQKGGIHNNVAWIQGWGATVNLKLSIDEKSGLNPGISLTQIFPNSVRQFSTGNVTSPQSFVLGIGASGSADATRTETIAFTYPFDQLLAEYRRHKPRPCSENEQGVLINSDLKIGQFIADKVFIASVPGTTEQKPGESPYSVFSYEVDFVTSYGGNVTPSWKFATVAANSTSPFFTANRQRTNDLTITLAPVVSKAKKNSPATLSPQAQDVTLAHLIGSAVATAIQSQQH